jgi:hypothetical protein
VATAVALGCLVALLRSDADARVKAAGTIVAMFLSTPYALDYDMMALAPAMALLLAHGLERGFRPYEKSALALAYAAPLLARPVAAALPLPLGAAAVILLFASTARCVFTKENQWEEAGERDIRPSARQSDADNSKQFLQRGLTVNS